jgi:glycosyltransferase involved in cell wall biosynthesis
MVAVEALAHGLALVGSRIGGLADVAKEANARLFELSQGAEGLADALKSLLLNPDALMNARRASLSMSARFDLKHSLDQYEQILRRSATRK